jgi:hypothetical protein
MLSNYLAVYFRDTDVDTMTECLRHMGTPPCLGVCGGWYIYKCPKGLLQRPWMKANIARMATFGVVAKVWQLSKSYPN